MISVTLPDGSIKELDSGSNGFDLAESIGPGLAKSAIAMTVHPVSYTHLTLPTKRIV